MTVGEMHQQFLHWFDKQSNNSAPEVTPEEIDIYLNNAVYFFLELLAEKGIERNQEWLDYTSNITIPYSTTPLAHQALDKPNGQLIKLPDDYRLSLLEEADIQYRDCNNNIVTSRIPVVPSTRDEYSKIVINPFKEPWKEEIIRITRDSGYSEIISFPNCTVTKYYLDYIQDPPKIQYGSMYDPPITTAPIDVNCKLVNKAATKIVEIAVKLALKTLGDERVKIEQLNPLLKTID